MLRDKLRAVSKGGNGKTCGHPSRRVFGAPQDEVSLF
jgi:hypothetical protein